MQTIEEICYIFQELARRRQTVTLLNAYRGIPISSQATIIEAVDIAIKLQTDRRQIVCIRADKGTFIQSPYLEKTIRAYTLQVDLPTMTAALTDYEIVSGNIGIRAQVRVAPVEPIKATLKVMEQDKSCRVDVADISLNGIGLYIDESMFLGNVLRQDAAVMIIVTLPGIYSQTGSTGSLISPADQRSLPSSASLRINPLLPMAQQETKTAAANRPALQETVSPELKIKGRLVNVRRDNIHKSYRLGVYLQPEEAARIVFSQYISQRQSDIIRELNRTYDDLLRAGNMPRKE